MALLTEIIPNRSCFGEMTWLPSYVIYRHVVPKYRKAVQEVTLGQKEALFVNQQWSISQQAYS